MSAAPDVCRCACISVQSSSLMLAVCAVRVQVANLAQRMETQTQQATAVINNVQQANKSAAEARQRLEVRRREEGVNTVQQANKREEKGLT